MTIIAHGHSMLRFIRQWCASSLWLCALAARADFQGSTHLTPFDEDTIAYGKTKSEGPVAKLQARLDRGQAELVRDSRYDFLLSVLTNLQVRSSSQMLVFSKTSFQRERIDPQHPRGIYFGDNVYVGYVPGSPLLEITEVDPKLGAVFYTLDQSQPKPRFTRTDQCLECHASARSMGVPGHLVRSFTTDERGVVDLASGISQVNHRTPFEERWGGWYVSGTHGKMTHRGNEFGRHPDSGENVISLGKYFDAAPYPQTSSDIVALLVLEHQTHGHNFLTRLNYESSLALKQYGHVRYLKNIADAFVKYLLFAEETPLASPVRGVSDFSREFAAAGPRDSRGRSLRDFDLQTRMFQYPCSYLIYSDAFAALPAPIREKVYERMLEVLTGKETGADYAKLSRESRRAILEILVETKSDLPKAWRTAARAG